MTCGQNFHKPLSLPFLGTCNECLLMLPAGTMLRNLLKVVPELSAFANIELQVAFNLVRPIIHSSHTGFSFNHPLASSNIRCASGKHFIHRGLLSPPAIDVVSHTGMPLHSTVESPEISRPGVKTELLLLEWG